MHATVGDYPGRALRRVTGVKLEIIPHASHTESGFSRSSTGHFILSDIKLRTRSRRQSQVSEIAIAEAVADYSADPGKNGGYGNIKHTLDDDPRNGWASFGSDLNVPRYAVFRLKEPIAIRDGDELVVELQQRALRGRHNIGRFRIWVTDQQGETTRSLEPAPLERLAEAKPTSAKDITVKDITAELRTKLFEHFLADDEGYLSAKSQVDQARSQRDEFRKAAQKMKVMVLREKSEPRASHVLVRGVWDAKGEVVERDVPRAVMPWPTDAPYDRLGLARWLTDRNNPLTARVAVNHFWGLLFGEGLVRTPEDFGVQGERPTHPRLLDWLAVELMENDWNVKHIFTTIVTSSTYRQSSHVTPQLRELDPENRLLARASRFRMPSWMIRDTMLSSAELLHSIVGGPPVRPYQPPGVWADITMGRFHYKPSVGAARYRRTLYAFWRRSAAPAFLFDSAKRRVCEVHTARTNTPLHALTLLNDTTTIEAARAIAHLVIDKSDKRNEQLEDVFLRVLSRRPTERETQVAQRMYDNAFAYYRTHPNDALSYVQLGQVNRAVDDPPKLAAMSVVVGTILNLDEAITRE